MNVLIIDDEDSVRRTTGLVIESEGNYVEGAANLTQANARLKEEPFDLILLDIHIGEENGLDYLELLLKKNPDQLVVMFTGSTSVSNAVTATKAGAFDYLSKPFSSEELCGILIKSQAELKRRKQFSQLETSVETLKTEIVSKLNPTRFDSKSKEVQDVLETLELSAKSNASILILGESGTGKSVIAKYVHDNSLVANKPFVTVSCPSLTMELLESELFGHVKGAFTGAIKDNWGKVHAASGGILFLDEIGELPIEIQPKLLRLLQEREYERLGENKTRTSNVRIIAATNRNLEECIASGTFREDLYYRINVISVTMPSLRQRKDDLQAFAQDYLEFFSKQMGKKIIGYSKEALDILISNPWLGNLRELRNAVERAVILTQSNEVQANALVKSRPVNKKQSTEQNGVYIGGKFTLDEVETEHIKNLLSSERSLQDVADTLGVDKATLYRKRKKLGL